MDELTPWHRLFGLQWMDFFHGLPVEVELEKDLSLKQQFLDIVKALPLSPEKRDQLSRELKNTNPPPTKE